MPLTYDALLSFTFYAEAIKVDPSWYAFFKYEIQQSYFYSLVKRLQEQHLTHQILPPIHQIFQLFHQVNLKQIRVVILGQDPYPNANANGIAFFCAKQPSPSLQNIQAEIQRSYGLTSLPIINLWSWLKQGVFLMNSIWTVNYALPCSHQNYGWETFTAHLLKYIHFYVPKKVFCLLGSKALTLVKAVYQDSFNELICCVTSHPSPLSAHRGFLGSGIFMEVNTQLSRLCLPTICWV